MNTKELYRTCQQATYFLAVSVSRSQTSRTAGVHAVTIHTETAARPGTETLVSLSHTCSPPRPPPRTSSHPFSHHHSCGDAPMAVPPGLRRRDHRGGRHPDGHQQQPRVDTGGRRSPRAATSGHPPPPPLALAPAVQGRGDRSGQ